MFDFIDDNRTISSVADLDYLVKAITNSNQFSIGEMIDDLSNHGINLSKMPTDETCNSNFDKTDIWSWAEPMAEHNQRPRYVITGNSASSLTVVDITTLDADAPLRQQIWMSA